MSLKAFKLSAVLISAVVIAACGQATNEQHTTVAAPAGEPANTSAHTKKGSASFTVVNTANQDFSNVPLIVNKARLKALGFSFETNTASHPVTIVSTDGGNSFAGQLDDIDQDGQWDELAFVLDTPANSEQSLTIALGMVALDDTEKGEQPMRTNIRFGKYISSQRSDATEVRALSRMSDGLPADYANQFQMEGPAWENDNIGFRLYFDERNGFDIFGKTGANIVLDSVGINENYHELQDWGMDILKVGRSLGSGALAFVDSADSASPVLTRVSNARKTSAEVVLEGPVRSILDLRYEGLSNAQGQSLNLNQRISIWAGQHFYSGELTLHNASAEQGAVASVSEGSSQSIAVGIVNLHDASANQSVINKHAVLASYKEQAEENTKLGMAVVTPVSSHLSFGAVGAADTGVEHSFFNVLSLTPSTSTGYDFYAVWQPRMTNIDSEDAFMQVISDDLLRKQSVFIR
ncbi:DUF4861 family protein [Glaciecola siphonariae]|uniref:DUF4861 family protein n=1 Tax=Glaciecola siphonariae TaxID=521012 RepID=A0ABV9LWT7_9ALTE